MRENPAKKSNYAKRRLLAVQRGIPLTMPLPAVRAHIDLLVAAGWSLQQIGYAANLEHSSLRWIYSRSENYVNARIGRRILAIRPDQLANATTGMIPAAGTLRRMQALMVMGWTHADISARVGFETRTFRPKHVLVRAQAAQAVRSVYDELSMRPGPSTETRRRAIRWGYLSPLAWDEDGPHGIDNPTALPNAGRPPRPVHIDDVAWLLRCGLYGEALAGRLGIQLDSVEAVCRRSGRHDLARWARTGIEPHRGAA